MEPVVHPLARSLALADRLSGGFMTETGTTGVKLCVVVSTLGDRTELRRLMESIARQTVPPYAVGIVDQRMTSLVSEIVADFRERLRIFVVESTEPGLSAGRNDVMRKAPVEVTHFIFPNDTSTYPPTLFERLVAPLAASDVVAMNYVDEDGPRTRIAGQMDGPLTKASVFAIIEPGMAIRASRLLEVGGFDPGVGTGSASRRQSGEGTDVLLRMAQAAPLRIRWRPDLIVNGVRQGYGLSAVQVRIKERAYGFGYGYLLGEWGFPLTYKVRALAGPSRRALSRSSGLSVRAALASTAGRFAGIREGRRARVCHE